MTSAHSTRKIGLWGAITTLVGFVIGVSIFLLPGQLAATTGPAVILSYAIASTIGIFSCLVAAQLGAVLPVTGASFICVARCLSPLLGFIQIWFIITGVALSMALIASGFADYFVGMFPNVDTTLCAVLIILLIGGLNLLGVDASVKIQFAMVAVILFVLLVFSVVGLAEMELARLTPFMPNGMSSVLTAAIPAFFSYAGFLMIVELGGEIERPNRNIPLTLLFSFLLVWIAYTAISLVLVGNVSWQELGKMETPVIDVASLFFAPLIVEAMTVAILFAAATSINGLLLGYSRDVVAAANCHLLPGALAGTTGEKLRPAKSILLLVGLALLATLADGTISAYATVIVVLLMLAQALIAVAVARLPDKAGRAWVAAHFQMGRGSLYFCCGGLLVGSVSFVVIGLMGGLWVLQISGGIITLGVFIHLLRHLAYKRRGINLSALAAVELEKY